MERRRSRTREYVEALDRHEHDGTRVEHVLLELVHKVADDVDDALARMEDERDDRS